GPYSSSFALRTDGRLLATKEGDGAIRLFDLTTERQVARFSAPGGQFVPLILSPDGRLLATLSGNRTLYLWKVAAPGALVRFPGPPDRINDLAFSPDSRLLATANQDGTIRLWNAAGVGQQRAGKGGMGPGTCRPIARLRGHTKPVQSLTFSADGKLLASG